MAEVVVQWRMPSTGRRRFLQSERSHTTVFPRIFFRVGPTKGKRSHGLQMQTCRKTNDPGWYYMFETQQIRLALTSLQASTDHRLRKLDDSDAIAGIAAQCPCVE